MLVRYLGHSAFYVRTGKGSEIVFDPYSSAVPYEFPSVSADVVLLSHEHMDHNGVNRVQGSPNVLRQMYDFASESEIVVPRTEETLVFHGVPTFHDQFQGKKKGKNTVWHTYIDGIHFAHLGDLGHVLDDFQTKLIGKVDVLALPVGGGETITSTEATIVADQLKAKVVLPMHYKTAQFDDESLCSETLEDFTSKVDRVKEMGSTAMELQLAKLPQQQTICILREYE